MGTTKKAIVKVGVACLISAGFAGTLLCGAREARADDATITVGGNGRFSRPPEDPVVVTPSQPIVIDDGRGRFDDERPPLYRSPFRLTLGPTTVTSGKGLGLGVGVGADFGTGSVGGRIAAAWVRGEGTNADGTSTPTGDAIGQYTGELTLDLHKRGPLHPVLGTGIGVLHISRPDATGYAGVGTARLSLEYALGLDDADVRLGADLTGALVGPVDSDVKSLKGYALTGVHIAFGF